MNLQTLRRLRAWIGAAWIGVTIIFVILVLATYDSSVGTANNQSDGGIHCPLR